MNGENIVFCDNLNKLYSGAKQKKALDSVSFSTPTKGIFALIGKNGAGKTTLVRILATELEPTSGIVTINGIDVVKEAKKLRERIATVPQEARPIPWLTPMQTVSSYLLWRGFSRGEAKDRAAESLAQLGLEKAGDQLNRTLSGGTKRKLLVATVLASDAEIIFLDEPTTGLDPISRREFWQVLREVGKKHFTFLTTHYLEEAEQLADVIGILEQGRMLGVDTLERLRTSAKYQYSIKIPHYTAPTTGEGVESLVAEGRGEVIREGDASLQIFTDEEEAFALSKKLFDMKLRFSVNPISLDEVFFYIISRSAKDRDAA